MKPFLLILVLSSLATIAVAQQVSGIYKYGDESLEFKGDSLDFFWTYGCCIISEFKGKAKWQSENGKIFIHMKNAENSNTILSTKSFYNDSSIIKFITASGEKTYPAVIFYGKGKLLWGMAANANGNSWIISKKRTANVDSVVIKSLGSQTQSFSFQSDNDYTVTLVEGYNNEVYSEIFGKGKGLKFKTRKNILLIKRPVVIQHKSVMQWVKYEKV